MRAPSTKASDLAPPSASGDAPLLAALRSSTPAAFVRAQREHVSLEALQAALVQHETSLSASLGTELQRRFGSLLDISGEVGATEDKLLELCVTLDQHRTASAECVRDLDLRAAKLSSAISERAALVERRDELRVVRRLIEALERMETIVGIRADGQHVGGQRAGDVQETLGATVARLMRASDEGSRCLSLSRRGAALTAVARQLERIAAARTELIRQLGACLRRLLEAAAEPPAEGAEPPADGVKPPANVDDGVEEGALSHDTLLHSVLWAYAQVEAAKEAATWVRHEWVRPRLSSALAPAGSSSATLGAAVDVLIAFAGSRAFAPLAAADGAARTPLNLLTTALWAEWCEQVTAKRSHAFGAGIPDTFHSGELPICHRGSTSRRGP